jgi:hypothetical protein
VTDPVRAIADAVLYEGYVLWPYRRSALKNQRRWTFGGVYPEAHHAGRDDDPCEMRTDCLLETDGDAEVDVAVRFLHVVRRRVASGTGPARRFVDELTVAGERHLAWEEAVEREVVVGGLDRTVAIDVPAGSDEEDLRDADGRVAGALVRSWEALAGSVTVAGRHVEPGLLRVTVTVANTTPWAGDDREAVLARTFNSTHTVLRARGGAWVSLTDPPAALRERAVACRA